jgi:hypothetical protein
MIMGPTIINLELSGFENRLTSTAGFHHECLPSIVEARLATMLFGKDDFSFLE